MCGIAGVLEWPGLDSVSLRESIARMVGAMIHRGPDEQAAVLFPGFNAALGAARLSMVDVAHGRQPVSSEDRQVWAVLNGEIYNYREIGEDLRKRGHRFCSDCDTEVLVHLYEEAGDAMFAELNGMYAAAIVDLRTRTVLVARDHAGMKPLYYLEREGGFAFASELKALIAGGLLAPEADWEELAHYLNYGYVPTPGCAFRRARKLLPGCYVRWRDGVSEIRRHWRPPEEIEPFGAQAPERLESLLRDATRSHLQGDVEVGCFLSGGWDSSIVASMAVERLRSLRTFALVLPESEKVNEAKHARAVAEALGTKHEEVEFRAAMLPRLLEEAAWKLEEPSSITPYVLLGLLSGLAARHVKTVVAGEGSDELFAGYGWLAPQAPYVLNRLVPSWAARMMAAVAPDDRWKRLFRMVAAADPDDIDFEYVRRGHPDDIPPATGLALRGAGGADAYAMVERQLGVKPRTAGPDRLPKRLMLEYGGRLTGAILFCADRMSMAESLEMRMPFLDRRVVEFAMRQPSAWKMHRGQEKSILKPIISRHAPVVAGRRKLGLHIPESGMKNQAFRDFAFQVLLDHNSLFKQPQLEPCLRRWSEHSRSAGLLLRLQLWWNSFLAPGSRGSGLATDPAVPSRRVAWIEAS